MMLLANPGSHFSPHKPIDIMGHFFHKASFREEPQVPPFPKAVRGRFLRQKHEANGANADYRWNFPLPKGHHWDSPLKKL